MSIDINQSTRLNLYWHNNPDCNYYFFFFKRILIISLITNNIKGPNNAVMNEMAILYGGQNIQSNPEGQ